MPLALEKESKLRKNLFYICEFIIAIVFVIDCRGIWNNIEPSRDWIGKYEIFVLVIAVICAILVSRTYLDIKRIAICLIVSAPICAYLLIYIYLSDCAVHIALRTLIALGFLLLFYYLCVEKDDIPDLLIKYNWVITIVAAFTVICWILFSIIRVAEPTAMVWDNWNDTGKDQLIYSYYGIYYEPQYTYVGDLYIARNSGIFVEAPMAALQFSVGLIIEFFIRKKTSIIRSIILIIALISTIATTAYLVVLIAVIIKIIMLIVGSEKYKAARKNTKTIVIVIISAVIVAGIVFSVIIFKDEFVNSSGKYRWEDFLTGFVGWSNNWLIGSGYGSAYAWCNSLSKVLADGGIWLGIAYGLPFVFGLIRCIKKKDIKTLFFIILTFLIIAITISMYTYLVLFIFIFYGSYKSKIRGKLQSSFYTAG